MMGEDLTICLQGIKQNKNKNNNINTKFLNSLLLLLLAIYSLIMQSVIYYLYLYDNSKTGTKYIVLL